MSTPTLTKRIAAATMALGLVFGAAACSDDDDEGIIDDGVEQDIEDGADDVEEGVEDGVDEAEQQVDEGAEEGDEGEG